jgi:hypothetical protein
MASDIGVLVETGGLIVNRIMWSDTVPTLDFGDGVEAVQEPADQSYAIGGTLIDGAYTPPPEPAPPSPAPPAPEPAPKLENVVLLDHENRLRALEGQPLLTQEDFAGLRK